MFQRTSRGSCRVGKGPCPVIWPCGQLVTGSAGPSWDHERTSQLSPKELFIWQLPLSGEIPWRSTFLWTVKPAGQRWPEGEAKLGDSELKHSGITFWSLWQPQGRPYNVFPHPGIKKKVQLKISFTTHQSHTGFGKGQELISERMSKRTRI